MKQIVSDDEAYDYYKYFEFSRDEKPPENWYAVPYPLAWVDDSPAGHKVDPPAVFLTDSANTWLSTQCRGGHQLIMTKTPETFTHEDGGKSFDDRYDVYIEFERQEDETLFHFINVAGIIKRPRR